MRINILWKRQAYWSIYLGFCLLVVLTSGLLLKPAYARTGVTPAPFHVKLLIITMFPAEIKEWLTHGAWDKVATPPGSIPSPRPNSTDPDDRKLADGVVFCQKDTLGNFTGICVTKTGVFKSNAASSLMADLAYQGLSYQGAYFLTFGTASTSPFSEGTLGFTAWANWVVDRDQQSHLIPKTAPGFKFGYVPPIIYPDGTAVFQLNRALVQKAYDLTAGLALDDNLKAEQKRALYPGQGSRQPYVANCDTITGDDVPIGTELSEETKYITSLLPSLKQMGSKGNYCTLEQEDTATATVLFRFHYTDQCYLNLRTASTFDQPPPGQTIESFIAEKFRVDALALDNAYKVATTVIPSLLLQPSTCVTPGAPI